MLPLLVVPIVLYVPGVFRLWDAGSFVGAVTVAVVMVILIEAVTLAVERAFVLHHRHPQPGSILRTVALFSIPPLIGLGVGYLAATVSPAFPRRVPSVAAVTLVYWLITVFLLRPWRYGISAEESHEKWVELKAMTREHFREENEALRARRAQCRTPREDADRHE